MQKLSDIKIGQVCIVKSLPNENRNRLLAMGLVPGTKVTLQRIAPVGDPLEFTLKNYSLSLRKELCQHVEVDLIE